MFALCSSNPVQNKIRLSALSQRFILNKKDSVTSTMKKHLFLCKAMTCKTTQKIS